MVVTSIFKYVSDAFFMSRHYLKGKPRSSVREKHSDSKLGQEETTQNRTLAGSASLRPMLSDRACQNAVQIGRCKNLIWTKVLQADVQSKMKVDRTRKNVGSRHTEPHEWAQVRKVEQFLLNCNFRVVQTFIYIPLREA